METDTVGDSPLSRALPHSFSNADNQPYVKLACSGVVPDKPAGEPGAHSVIACCLGSSCRFGELLDVRALGEGDQGQDEQGRADDENADATKQNVSAAVMK